LAEGPSGIDSLSGGRSLPPRPSIRQPPLASTP
jgi:hypothetical protein